MGGAGRTVLLGAIGACIGSFAATAAARAIQGQSALSGRSRCDGCGATLSWWETIPLLSFAVVRGSCRRCGERIDRFHLVGEVSGLCAGVCAATFEPVRAIIPALVLAGALTTDALIDVRSRRLPDILTILVALGGLAMAAMRGWPNLAIGLIAAVATFMILEALRRAYQAARGLPGLGQGDVKLLSALALWLGAATPLALAFAACGTLIFVTLRRPADGRIAFGPAVALGGWVVGIAKDAGGLTWLS